MPPATDAGLAATTPWQRVRAPLVTAGLVAGATLALRLRDPHDSGSWGFCPWLVLTGSYCPGCGGLRAVNDLSHGDLVAAAGSNLVFVASIPLLVWMWARWTTRAWSGEDRPGPVTTWTRAHGSLLFAAFVAVLLLFGVLRNLPGSWLAP